MGSSLGWTDEDRVPLCRAYPEVSEDPVTAIGRSKDQLWATMHEKWTDLMNKKGPLRVKRNVRLRGADGGGQQAGRHSRGRGSRGARAGVTAGGNRRANALVPWPLGPCSQSVVMHTYIADPRILSCGTETETDCE